MMSSASSNTPQKPSSECCICYEAMSPGLPPLCHDTCPGCIFQMMGSGGDSNLICCPVCRRNIPIGLPWVLATTESHAHDPHLQTTAAHFLMAQTTADVYPTVRTLLNRAVHTLDQRRREPECVHAWMWTMLQSAIYHLWMRHAAPDSIVVAEDACRQLLDAETAHPEPASTEDAEIRWRPLGRDPAQQLLAEHTTHRMTSPDPCDFGAMVRHTLAIALLARAPSHAEEWGEHQQEYARMEEARALLHAVAQSRQPQLRLHVEEHRRHIQTLRSMKARDEYHFAKNILARAPEQRNEPDQERARKCLTSALTHSAQPELRIDAYKLLGDLEFQRNPALAADMYRCTIALHSTARSSRLNTVLVHAHLKLAQLCTAATQPDRAQDVLRRALAICTRYHSGVHRELVGHVYMHLAQVRHDLNHHRDAIAWCERTLDIHPDHVGAHGLRNEAQKMLEMSAATRKRALPSDDEYPEAVAYGHMQLRKRKRIVYTDHGILQASGGDGDGHRITYFDADGSSNTVDLDNGYIVADFNLRGIPGCFTGKIRMPLRNVSIRRWRGDYCMVMDYAHDRIKTPLLRDSDQLILQLRAIGIRLQNSNQR